MSTTASISTDEQAEKLLDRAKKLALEIQFEENTANEDIDAAKERLESKVGKKRKQLDSFIDQVHDYFDTVRKTEVLEAKGANKVLFNAGTITFRKGQDKLGYLDGYDEPKAIKAIREHSAFSKLDLIQEKLFIIKNNIKALTPDNLSEIGVKIIDGEVTTNVELNLNQN